MQIEISNDEYEKLSAKAIAAGYADVTAFVKALAIEPTEDPRGTLSDNELAASLEMLRESEQDIAAGRTQDMHEALREIADKHGIDFQGMIYHVLTTRNARIGERIEISTSETQNKASGLGSGTMFGPLRMMYASSILAMIGSSTMIPLERMSSGESMSGGYCVPKTGLTNRVTENDTGG